MKPLEAGERIHLVNRKDKHFSITLARGAIFQYSGETLPHSKLIGQWEGVQVQTSRGTQFIALRPTLGEHVLKMPRGAQVVYPKELAMILLWGDIYPGATVFEAGMGSGALTMALLRAVGEKGRVISYEIRSDFKRRALENVHQHMGHVDNLFVDEKDAYQGIEEEPLDRVILDLPEPWQVIPHTEHALRPGGILVSLSPTVPQVEKTVQALRDSKSYALIETFETLLRHWNIEGRSVRPDHRMVAHTAFLTVARKVPKPLDSRETRWPT